MIISARNISKQLDTPDGQKVLDSISLDIYAGELVSIFGESGSGKSSLLYILATLDTEFSGDLTLVGNNVRKMTKEELAWLRSEHIGYVYQFHHLLPEFSVLQNIMLAGLKLNPNEEKETKDQALSL